MQLFQEEKSKPKGLKQATFSRFQKSRQIKEPAAKLYTVDNSKQVSAAGEVTTR